MERFEIVGMEAKEEDRSIGRNTWRLDRRQRSRSRSLVPFSHPFPVDRQRSEESGGFEWKSREIGLDKMVLVIGEVRRDPRGHRSRGKVLFNGIVRPSTMLIPLGTRSLLGRLGH